MSLDKQYYIHSRGGRIGEGLTTLDELEALVAAVKASPQRHLIIHFHGGLVPQAAGFAIAEKLLPVYSGGGHPVFFVWESGAWETIRNNITELADEPVFKQLLRKLLEYTLDRLGGTDGARSIRPGKVDPRKVRETLDEFIRHPGPDTIPYKDFVPVVAQDEARSAADGVDVDEIQADLETDPEVTAALATLPDVPPETRSAFSVGPVITRDSPFSRLVSERVSKSDSQRGLISLYKVASLLARMLMGVLRRYHHGRDHGLYATVVEELLRAFKMGGSSVNEWGKALEWNRMKQDCEDAFGGDPNVHAGSALLTRIRDDLDAGKALKRITLVGHSTGGVYICAWIEAAAAVLAAEVQFDVVLLAPAVSYGRFAGTLAKHASRIGRFRMFAMSDLLERADQVWGDDTTLPGGQDWRRFIYPSSLLYLVSGILESKSGPDGELLDEPDMPLLGMQRFFSGETIYDVKQFPEVDRVRSWLRASPQRMVWSFADGIGEGLNSHCNDHGAFDDEETTLASLRHIVTEGF